MVSLFSYKYLLLLCLYSKILDTIELNTTPNIDIIPVVKVTIITASIFKVNCPIFVTRFTDGIINKFKKYNKNKA